MPSSPLHERVDTPDDVPAPHSDEDRESRRERRVRERLDALHEQIETASKRISDVETTRDGERPDCMAEQENPDPGLRQAIAAQRLTEALRNLLRTSHQLEREITLLRGDLSQDAT